jgi:hypothetical protein
MTSNASALPAKPFVETAEGFSLKMKPVKLANLQSFIEAL